MLLATSLPVVLLGLWFLPAGLIVLLYLCECLWCHWKALSKTEGSQSRQEGVPPLPVGVSTSASAGNMEVLAVLSNKAGETHTLRWHLSMN